MCSQGLFHFPWHGGATQEKETTRRNCARRTSPRICTNFRQEELFTRILTNFQLEEEYFKFKGSWYIYIYIAEIIWMTWFSVTLDEFEINVYSHQLNPSYTHIRIWCKGASDATRKRLMRHAHEWSLSHLPGSQAKPASVEVLILCRFCMETLW